MEFSFMQKIDFFFRYFFLVLTGLIVLGVFNGLIFLPVLLVLVGPPGEVIPNDNGDAIDPPTPNVETIRRGSRSNPLHKSPPNNIKITNLHHHHSKKHHHQSDLSLSTIAEESGSYASSAAAVQEPNNAYPLTSQSFNGASVFVEPHVVVETTTYPSTSHVSLINDFGNCFIGKMSIKLIVIFLSFFRAIIQWVRPVAQHPPPILNK